VEAVDDAHRDDLRRQVTAIRRACDARGIELVDIVPDRESSGPVVDRPGFDRVLRRHERGDATCLVAADVERLAASSEEWLLLLQLLDDDDVRLVVADEGIDTGSDAGRAEAWSLTGRPAPHR
jgi:DNA invertase Pin-like site-specific DNA recombinase